MHLGARHEVAAIRRRGSGPFNWFEEARPARTALEFRTRLEQRQAASHARERTRPLLVEQRTRSGAFGTVLAEHVVLLGRQLLAPFRFRLCDFEGLIRTH